MKYCHTCNAQFPDEHRRCLHCRGRLGTRPAARAAPSAAEGPQAPEFVLLARREPAKAVSLLEALQAEGIAFEVIGDGGTDRVNAFFGSSGAHAAVEVHVHPGDLDRAHALTQAELSPLLAEPAHDFSESGACPGCGQRLSDRATECPKCGLCFPE